MKVIQCWDDGVVDDVRLTEMLRRRGAKATFNLNAGLHGAARGGIWRFKDIKDVLRLARPELLGVYEGFAVANHSYAHKWPTRISLAEWEEDVRAGREALEQMFQRPITGFAYPYGDCNEPVKDAVRRAGHVYARTTKRVETVWPPVDPMEFHASCHFLAADFWVCYGRVKAAGGVFYFWGHSYELVTEEQWQEFDRSIARISADPAAQWCDILDLFDER